MFNGRLSFLPLPNNCPVQFINETDSAIDVFDVSKQDNREVARILFTVDPRSAVVDGWCFRGSIFVFGDSATKEPLTFLAQSNSADAMSSQFVCTIHGYDRRQHGHNSPMPISIFATASDRTLKTMCTDIIASRLQDSPNSKLFGLFSVAPESKIECLSLPNHLKRDLFNAVTHPSDYNRAKRLIMTALL